MPDTPNPESRRGMSLHIGVNLLDPNHYKGWDGKLSSCENDADTYHRIALARGFEARQLKTEQATRDNVISAIREAASTLRGGDIFWVSYAGHGGRLTDSNGDEADGKDDTWCLHDAQLLDDEMAVLWADFRPGVRILVVSDSCHSGTLLKDENDPLDPDREDDEFTISRRMPREARLQVAEAFKRFYRDIQRNLPRETPRIRASVRLLAGCEESQESFGSKVAGRFTSAVVDVFNDGQFEGSYADLHREVRARVEARGKPQSPAHAVRGKPDRDFDTQVPFTV